MNLFKSILRLNKTYFHYNFCQLSAIVNKKISVVGCTSNSDSRKTLNVPGNITKPVLPKCFKSSKGKIILQLNFESAEDSLPFYELPFKTLLHILKCTQNDDKMGYCKNRLYYISSQLKCSPAYLSQKIAQRTFVYSLSFEWLQQSLRVLLDMGVAEDRILRDLWVLKYHHKTIHQRLTRIKEANILYLCPWMVRCSEDILNRFIDISQETKNILGDTKTTQIYLANRLNTTTDIIQDLYQKSPALKTTRVTKVKPFLDFLLNEGFNAEDIISKPRILCASQKTVEQRLLLLRKFGIKEINLNVLCRSRKDFKRYCDSMEAQD